MAADDRTLTADSASILAAATEPSVEVAPSGELAIGTHLGRYEVVERIGAGGMGVVYRARDPALGRDLAIKVVPSTGGGEAQARLLREAQAMAQLRRQGVVPVFDVGTIGAGVFVVMPYLSGGTLGGWLAAAPRPWREVLDRFVAAGRGLAVAHAAGLVHRDFKPDNVLVDERGEVAVADFGLARAAHASDPDARGARGASSPDITRVGAIVGTPAYMAPEQLRGEPFDARADIFGFCISLYQGLYGERPFAMSTGRGGFAVADLLDAIVAQRVRPPGADRRVPVWLRSAVVRGLAADPRDRWPSVDALLAHIDARRRRPRRIAIAIAIAVALAAAAAGIALVTRAAPPPSPPVAYHEQRISSRGDVGAAALSPDGHHVIAIAGSDLLLFDLDRRDPPRTLATDANPVSSNMTAPTWSPDGHELLYQCYAGSPSKVWCAASLDGPAHAPPMQYQGLTFARDGAVVVSAQPMRGFSVVGADGIVRSACQIPGDYTFVERVVVSPTTDDVFVVVSTGLLADRIYHADLGCTHVEPIVTDVPLLSFAPSADGTGLVAMRLQGERAEAISIDRGGEIRSLGAPSFDPTAMIAGARTDGSLVVVDGEYAWRLLRVDRAGHTAEIAAASGRADLALSPDRTRLAVIELAYDGGVLRVGQLARPQELGPAIADHALEADWSPDGRRLATITHDGGAMHLVVLDPDGGHRDVRPLDDASPDGELTWIGPDQIAYQLHGNVGYAVIDLATGARHDLFDRTLGWAFELIRAPSGALAWEWNRMPANSIWMTPPAGGAPRFVSFAPGGARPVWTPDGDLLTAADRSPTIVHVDPATGRTEPYVTLPVEHGVTNGRLFALDGGDLLVQRSSSVTDVELVTPER